ncbi:MAG: SdrD B-like domain-containing protein [Acidobacteriota bacterium]
MVEVRSSNFTAPGTLTGCVSVLNDAGDPDTDVDDSDDNGVGVTPGANGIRSLPITLGPAPGSEPTNETDLGTGDPAEPNGATNLTLDFGFAPIYSLGNRVWKDTDNSGTINGAETGVNGVVLRLLTSPGLVQATDATGALVADQTTANDGYYRFDNILTGDYVVEVRSSNFTAPGTLAGCVSVLGDAGDPDTDVDDSDENGVGVTPGANGIRSLPVTLGPQPGSEPTTETDRSPSDPAEPNGNTNLTVDFGFAPIYSLGNRVWKDLNNSGTIDAADGTSPGINGVVVRLLTSPGLVQATDMNGVLVPDQTTANGGYYRFDNILGGDYVVEVRSSNFTAPGTLAGCVSVLTDAGDPDTDVDDSDENGVGVVPGANGIRSAPITLGPAPGSEPTNEADLGTGDPAEPNGSTNLTIDFGFAPIYSLGNRVWKDVDNSGTLNGAETGINGVVVRLLTSPGLIQATDMNGALVADQTTANNGYYRFDNILGGDYVVEVRSSNFTSPGVLTGCVTSTGTNGLVGATGPFEPAPDADTTPADSDDNGQVAGAAVQSKPVTLGPAPGSEPTTEADRSPSDPAEPNGATNLTVDFGFTTPMNLGNLVWKDLNLNGLRDGSPLEPGIDGVKVVLWGDNGDGVFGSTTDTMLTMLNTSGGGTFSFTNVLPGNYFVVVDQSNFGAGVLGNCLSSFGADTGDQVDGNDNGADNQTPATSGVASSVINLTGGAEPANDGDGNNGNLTIDFGFILPSDFAFGGSPGSGIPGKVYEGDPCNGATGAYVLTLRNIGTAAAIPGAIVTDVIPTGITPLAVSGSAGWSCAINGQTVTCTSTASFAVNAVAQFRITVAIGYNISGPVTNTATVGYAGDPINPNNSASTTINIVSGLGVPGKAFENNGSSVLVFPIFTSSASAPNSQNTRINLTNISDQKPICVHLFFVDGASCSVADSILCLTANQTTSFLASDLDPGTTGYIVAVAIDCNGCPTNFNFLVGDEFVKFSSGHRGNVIAEGVAALPGLPTCDNNSVTAALNFDGVSYGRFGRVLAMDNFGSRADGNDTMLIVDRIGGNLGIGAATLGTLFGIMYDDAEAGISFSVTGACQLRSSLTNNFPRTTPRFETFIPAGRSGWLKLFSQSDVALVGASINYNANSGAQMNAFNGAHNLHRMMLSSAGSYIIPVFPAIGCQ